MLKVEGLNTFYGGAHILHDVALEVGRGQVVALLGRNGAGKSTTMKSIMGVVKARSGRVTFDDRDISGQPAHQICQAGLGYVPEERRIFRDLTILENLEVGRRPARDGAPSWSVDKLFQLFPNLRERKENLGSQMSGGEQQMLTIARTLMGNPSMILLDEPSEGIAPVIVEQMAHTILEMKREGLTVILSEQNLHFAKVVSDQAIIIESGQIRYQGTMADLEAQPDIREKYLAV
ncbi:ABC transporter ATP-binding protein [Rhodovibrionaceae bacterium A322]